MKVLFGLLPALLGAFSVAVAEPPPAVEIKLAHNTPGEARTCDQLNRLLQQYPLAPWYFTKTIHIDEKAIPHSHPVLTLHTRHLKDDDLLLSSFVHEQIHWFLEDHHDDTKAAEDELRTLFPKLPVGFPDGALDEESDYLHLLVNFLEWRSDRQLLGDLRARQIMEFWARDHYRVLYQTVLEHASEIGAIVAKHHLDFPTPHGE
ncbi:MAG TPA: hypothetical protein VGW57_12500 [Chthoniobacterales bacterium]|nr:hypothetical protein [Chthoniobacterales bacterium]